MTYAAVPLPERLNDCGLFPASSEKVMEPLRAPAAVGVKVTIIVQLTPIRTLLPQLSLSAKSPLLAMLVIFNVALPVLVKVTACDGLVVPTG